MATVTGSVSGTGTTSSGGEGDAFAAGNAPILILPEFNIEDTDTSTLSKAVVKISDGFAANDSLEIDSNYTPVQSDDKLLLENTNIEIVDGGFNKATKSLTLQGEDSTSTYGDVLESILLNNGGGLAGSEHTISFSLYDADGHHVHLPAHTVEVMGPNMVGKTVLDELSDNLNLSYWLSEDSESPVNNSFDEMAFEDVVSDDRNIEGNVFPTPDSDAAFADQAIYSDWLQSIALSDTSTMPVAFSDQNNWVNNMDSNSEILSAGESELFLTQYTTDTTLSEFDDLTMIDIDKFGWG